MEHVNKLMATNEIVKTFEHRGETFRIRKRGCEGNFAHPGYYWMIGWQMSRMQDGKLTQYEKVAAPVWEPCSEDDLAKVIANIEEDARRWASSPNE